MIEKEALEIIKQLARMTPVTGDVGDKRDEAIQVLEKSIANNVKEVTA